jgi:hypothetical protein
MPEGSILVKGEDGTAFRARIFALLAVVASGDTVYPKKLPVLESGVKDRYLFTLSDYSVILGAENHGTDPGETNPCGRMPLPGRGACLRNIFPNFNADGLFQL